jgi:hypothetical protein
MVLLPQDWMPFWNERWKPLMSDIIAITVATPIMIPSSASSDRMRFAGQGLAGDAERPRGTASTATWGRSVAHRDRRVETAVYS